MQCREQNDISRKSSSVFEPHERSPTCHTRQQASFKLARFWNYLLHKFAGNRVQIPLCTAYLRNKVYGFTHWFCEQIRYAEHLPSVLKNITCTFPGRKKVGVVGRTGSGKSTLIQAIFRVVEAREGSIVIDNVDISKIGLHDLRSRLSIIPQDPTMFEGTVRGNLDPLNQHSDTEIWEVNITILHY